MDSTSVFTHSLFTLAIGVAATCLVARSLIATAVVFPVGPRPVSCLRLALLLLRRFPPMQVSSNSTGPVVPVLPDAMQHLPCGLLGDFPVAMEFHARNPLQVCGYQIDCEGSLLVSELRSLHERPGLRREVLAAIAAAEWLGLASRPLLHVQRSAIRAADSGRPAAVDEPVFRCRIVGEHGREFDQGDALAVGFARGFAVVCLPSQICTIFPKSRPDGKWKSRTFVQFLGKLTHNPVSLPQLVFGRAQDDVEDTA